MTMNPVSHEKDLGSKKEEEAADERKSSKIITPSSSSSRQWSSSFKNPRIVRVSRTFGGKDRHSKVCTVRGLRDRRIRLSVPTAIQLYDLQDRLGLTQPSKVIDWLIDATKHEIDKLPPLPMLPTNFLHYFHQPSSMLANNNTIIHPHDHHPLLSPNDLYKERERWNINTNTNTSTSTTLGSSQNDDVDGEGGFGGFVAQLSTAHNFFPLNSQFSVPNMPYNSNYFQLDSTPNLSLSQFGGGFSDHHHHHQPHESNCSLSSSLSSSQIYMCPSASSITPPPPPGFAPLINAAPSLENDHQYQFRQINHYQNSVLMPTTLHLINSPIKSFTSLHSNPNETGKQDEDRSS